MQRSLSSQFFAYALMLTLVGSLFTFALPAFQPTYASHENITVEIDLDDVTDVYEGGDDVSIVGLVDDIIDNEEVIIRVAEPGDSGSEVESDEPNSSGNFNYNFDVPNSPEEGVYTVEAEYDGESAYTYFKVDGEEDTIFVALDNDDSIYEPGDDVLITGQVDEDDNGEPDVVITVLDPTNDEIVDEEEVELDGDEFEYEFTLDNDAPHGRYAVIVTYEFQDQEGSALFELEDDGSGSNDNDDNTGEDSVTEDSDGNLSAEIDEAVYEQGESVQIMGEINNYDSADNEDLSITIFNPDDESIDVEDNLDVDEDGSDGTFEFEHDIDDNAEEGLYTIEIAYDSDEVELVFEVIEGSGSNDDDDDSDSDITVRLNKGSYLAGDSITVTGTVADVADPEDGERVSIFMHEPRGQVILESGSSKFVTPTEDGDYSATILIPSDLEVDEDYFVHVGYLGASAEASFDITGVSSNPSGEISVETDEDEYTAGSTVEISGEVPDALLSDGDEPILIKVSKPDGNPCRIDQAEVSSSGSFSYSMVIGGTCNVDGEYEVEVSYNGEESDTTFELTGSATSGARFNLVVDDDTYPIEYELSDGSIDSMFVRPNENKLVITLDAEDDGQLTLALPREVIDAIEDGEDIDFVVTIEDSSGNVEIADIDETDNDDDIRTIVIDYEGGAERIEIAGTQVVPEFGAIAGVIMALAIVGIILATSRSGKLSFFRQ